VASSAVWLRSCDYALSVDTESRSAGEAAAAGASEHTPAQSGGTAPVGGTHNLEFCRIERWRGYVSSTFYARTTQDALHESKPFRWRRAEVPPDEGAARAAYDDLVARLRDDGWQPYEQGRVWYATTFARTVVLPVAAPLPRTAVPTLPPPPAAAPSPARPSAAPLGPRPAEHRSNSPERHDAAVPPPPAEAPAASGEEDGEQPGRHRRLWRLGVASGGALITAVAVAMAFSGGHPASAHPPGPANAHAVAHPRVARADKATRTSAPAPVLTPAVTMVDLRIAAHGNGSWVDVKRGSRSGKVLFSGVLHAGKGLHFRARLLWVRFGAAGNLTVTANRKPVTLRGTYEKLFAPPAR
jgi:hypothetical protein